MRINYNKTCLDYLETKQIGDLALETDWPKFKSQLFYENLVYAWPSFAETFRAGKVQHITYPFYEAYYKNRELMGKLLSKESLGEKAGTMLFNISSNIGMTVFYHIIHEQNKPLEVTYFEFVRTKHPAGTSLAAYVRQYVDEKEKLVHDYFTSTTYKEQGGLYIQGVTQVAELLGLLLFLEVCETEVKTMPPNHKFYSNDEKYFNETRSPIEIVDSTWFTTTVRREGFPVSGHFRLQPYKTGKRLIWIEGYEKHGYTRRAKTEKDK